MNKFMIKDENGVEREATLITVIENEGKKYAVYSIDRDNENVNIFVSNLTVDESGNNIISDIDDQNEKNKVAELVKNIIKLPLVGDE